MCCVGFAVTLATWFLCTGVLLRCAVCAVSLATWLLFTGASARVACTVSLVTWLLLTSVVRVRCPWPLGACSAVCSVVVQCLRRPWSLGSCPPVCRLGLWCCVCGVCGHSARVQRCARSTCCVVRSLSLTTWLLFTGVHPPCVVLRVRCPWLLGSCSPLCFCGAFCVVCCGVLRFCVSAVVLSCARRACAPYAFLVCCVFLGVVVVAWHLVLCLGCGCRRACLGCLLALGWCAVPRPVWSPLVRRSALSLPLCLPLPGARAPRSTEPLRRARGGRPETRLMVPAVGPRRRGSAGPAQHCTCAGPQDGVIPGRSLRRWSHAACAAVVFARVDALTHSSGFPYRPSLDRGMGRCTWAALVCGPTSLLPGRTTPRLDSRVFADVLEFSCVRVVALARLAGF